MIFNLFKNYKNMFIISSSLISYLFRTLFSILDTIGYLESLIFENYFIVRRLLWLLFKSY